MSIVRFLKAVCVVLGFIFFLGIPAPAFMFEAGTIGWITALVIGVVSFILVLICGLGYQILKDHEEASEWLDFLKEGK